MEDLWKEGQVLARMFVVKLANSIYRLWDKEDVPVSFWKLVDGVIENAERIKCKQACCIGSRVLSSDVETSL